ATSWVLNGESSAQASSGATVKSVGLAARPEHSLRELRRLRSQRHVASQFLGKLEGELQILPGQHRGSFGAAHVHLRVLPHLVPMFDYPARPNRYANNVYHRVLVQPGCSSQRKALAGHNAVCDAHDIVRELRHLTGPDGTEVEDLLRHRLKKWHA